MRTLQVTITRASDGESRTYADVYENTETHPECEECAEPDAIAYQWGEGNYSCDCNRGLFFWRASGGVGYESHPCGHDGYWVTIRDEGGAAVFKDRRHP